jgi:hypothetical protein
MKPMIEALSRDASFARARGHEGPSGKKSRARAMLLVLHRLVIAALAVIIAAGIAIPGWGSARLIAAAFDATTRDTAGDERDLRESERVQWWQDDAAHAEVDQTVIESDGDEDGDEDGDGSDLPCDLAGGAARSLHCVPFPPKPGRALRGELPIDTSRFAAGTRLPRGPPAFKA